MTIIEVDKKIIIMTTDIRNAFCL